jgi:hypothetical protein
MASVVALKSSAQGPQDEVYGDGGRREDDAEGGEDDDDVHDVLRGQRMLRA